MLDRSNLINQFYIFFYNFLWLIRADTNKVQHTLLCNNILVPIASAFLGIWSEIDWRWSRCMRAMGSFYIPFPSPHSTCGHSWRNRKCSTRQQYRHCWYMLWSSTVWEYSNSLTTSSARNGYGKQAWGCIWSGEDGLLGSIDNRCTSDSLNSLKIKVLKKH